jgi:hypothetical protein
MNLSDDNYKSILAGFGVESCTALGSFQATGLISKLSKLVPAVKKSPKKYYGTGERGEQHHLTQLQAERIEVLEKMLNWERSSTVTFIIKQVGAVKCVSMLMNYEAVKVITGMQRVLAFDMAKSAKGNTGSYWNERVNQKEFFETINNSTNNELKEANEKRYNNTAERG